jgi:threonine/homoserine/homoserine lactone efflux protein
VDLVPIAIAIALSPFPIVPVVLLLLTARPLANGGGFLAGWFGGLLLLTAALTAAASAIELWDEVPTWASWTRLVLGGALVVLGVRAWVTRGGGGETPSWMAALDDYTTSRSARLGLILAVANPKIILLTLAGGVTIGAAGLGLGQAALVVLLFAAASAVTVALPVVLRLGLGPRVEPPLRAARRWLLEHNDAIVAVVLVAIGIMVAAKGWSTL